MKVLWFEVTIPKNYSQSDFHGAGWQDALESIIKKNKSIELAIAFESQNKTDEKSVFDGVTYFPLIIKIPFWNKFKNKFSTKVNRGLVIEKSLIIIEEFKPDIIHVFGSEWCFGHIASFTNIPVVIHMQGSIPPYNNAFYPPGYSYLDEFFFMFLKLKWKSLFEFPLTLLRRDSWKQQEEQTLKIVNNYMGRTTWDKSIIKLYNPNANYFHCNESLREHFLNSKISWSQKSNKKIRLITTGCSSLWKGLDTIVRTAKILKDINFDFEWFLAGKISNLDFIEWKENLKMKNLNIKFLGMIDPELLIQNLIKSDIYIHTAYIDNSPNSISEAQILGLPIIATYVGGIPSLIENEVDGILIPANDPFSLSSEIMKLSKDKIKQRFLSQNAVLRARDRHDPVRISESIHFVYDQLNKSNI